MGFWPDALSATEHPGRVERELRTSARVQDGRLVFHGELHDRWTGDDEPPETIHWYEVELETVPPNLKIVSARARARALPYPECPLAAHALERLVGAELGRGFRRRAQAVLGSVEGCTHLLTLVTTIWGSQVVSRYLVARPDEHDRVPVARAWGDVVVDSCRGLRHDGSWYQSVVDRTPRPVPWRDGQPVPPDSPPLKGAVDG